MCRPILKKEFMRRLYDIHPKTILISDYVNEYTHVIVIDEVGIIYKSSPHSLLTKRKPTIRSALNKNTAFSLKNQIIGNSNYDFKDVEYINSSNEVIVYDSNKIKHLVKPSSLLQGFKLGIHSAVNKTDYLLSKSVSFINEGFDLSMVKYNGHKEYVTVVDSLGISYNILPINLINSNIPTVSSAIDKTEWFIKKSKEIHGERYGYNKCNYKSAYSKVFIKCNKHGIFKQSPIDHLKGSGCRLCANEDLDFGWGFHKWMEAANNSDSFDSFKVYIIRCFNETESFYKIGRTFTTVKRRFESTRSLPYGYEIVATIASSSAKYIFDTENKLHRINKKNKYKPKIHFNGYNECFKKVNYV